MRALELKIGGTLKVFMSEIEELPAGGGYVTLSYDHRVVDGAIAHQFLHKVKETLENWSEPLV